MSKKICCKSCEFLNFYDWYFCGNKILQENENNNLKNINDVDNFKCKFYKERKDKFWTDGEW